MKKSLLSILGGLLALCFSATAQVTLSGSLSGTYASLTAAFTAINGGVGSGAVTATITADHTLTATAQLNQTNYTVTIVPSGTRVVSANISGAMLLFNGADNTMLDGQNTLTLRNTSTGTAASVITLQVDALGNTIKNCNLEGATTGTGWPFNNGVVNVKALGGTTGCDNNTIMGNKIHDAFGSLPRHCIVAEGFNASVMNDNLVISNNEIYNFWMSAWAGHGVYSYRYNKSMQITGNSFYQTAARTGSGGDTYTEPIFVEDGNFSTLSGGYTISNNFIGGSAASCGGAAYTVTNAGFGAFQAMSLAFGTSAVNNIQGNVIKNINFSTDMPYTNTGYWFFRGIGVWSGAANIGTTSGNTIGATTGTGSIVLNCNNATNGGLYGHCIIVGSGNTCSVKNNNIGSVTFNEIGTGTGELSGYGILTFNDLTTIENNLIGSLTTPNSFAMTGSIYSPWGRLQGILAETGNTLVKSNTIKNNSNDIGNGGELTPISIWCDAAGKTQTVQDNIIQNCITTSGGTVDVTGILAVSYANTNITYTVNITGNTISDLSNTASTTGECDVNGIWVVRRGTSSMC